MPLDEPAWWYAPRTGAWARSLSPAAWLYGHLARLRLHAAPRHRSPLPVVCVGNFTVGGTGKTPLSLALATILRAEGREPWFLTRGYGGRLAGPHRVQPGRDAAREVGDEALLLAEVAPTVLARDRRLGALAIEGMAPGHAVIVMDDGLQNPALAKDLVLAVVDGRRGLGNGLVFPAGPLRAPIAAQLALADAIVVNRGGSAPAPPAQLERLRREFPGPWLAATTQTVGEIDWLNGAAVVAFAGIANPDRFFGMLIEAGARLVAAERFPDHHALSSAEAERLLLMAERTGALLVTTAKDRARLSGAPGVCATLRQTARTLPVRLALEGKDDDRLVALVRGVLRPEARSGPPAVSAGTG